MLQHTYKIQGSIRNCATLDVEQVGIYISDGWKSEDDDGNELPGDYKTRINLAKENKIHSKTHADGWTISGKIREDWFIWVQEFRAEHPVYGKVFGDFEKTIYSDTQEGYDDFLKNHPPSEWDAGDI